MASTETTTISQREKLIYLAKLAEQGERYDEMADFMQQVAEIAVDELSVEERNLLSVAFKNAVGARRASLRIVSSVEQKHKKRKESSPHGDLATKYRESVEQELHDFCSKILKLIDDHFLKMESISYESKVFYYKMKGDYYRYLAEFNPTEKPEEIEKARASYEQASCIAEDNLAPTHPIRLGLALNFSVFYFEILANSTHACQMAQQAFDDAIKALDTCVESHYRDSTLIMQLLRDNLTLWQSDSSVEQHPEETG